MSTIKPIFLLADSQLLFWRDEGELFLGRVRALLDADGERAGRAPQAAYLGASNGDAPEFYHLFVAAMEQVGIHDCRHVPALPAAEDLDFLAGADLILLAGGEVRRGWDAFKAAGLDQKLVERYYGGALLLGVSAGAVQLGLKGWDETGAKMSDMLRIVPFVVDVHDEPGWARLLQAVPRAGEHARGIGIPSGGGALYHPDYSVEPVRHPLVEVNQTESGLQQALLLPGQAAAPGGGTEAAAGAPAAAGDAAAGATMVAGDAAARATVVAGDAAAGAAVGDAAAGATVVAGDAAAAADAAAPADVEKERRELGYSIGADGVIEILRPEDREPVN